MSKIKNISNAIDLNISRANISTNKAKYETKTKGEQDDLYRSKKSYRIIRPA